MSDQEKIMLPEVIYFRWENEFWNADAIEKLTGIDTYSEYKKV